MAIAEDEEFLNPTGLSYLFGRLKQIFVSQESGKGLSTEDYTTSEKTKLGTVESGSQANVIEAVTVNGSAVTPVLKTVDVTVPTKTSDILNDSGYQDSAQVQALINSAIAGITGIEFVVVEQLPASGEAGKIYFLSNAGSAPNVYDEYIWLSASSTWEKIGTTEVDLSSYWNEENLVALTTERIDEIIDNAE